MTLTRTDFAASIPDSVWLVVPCPRSRLAELRENLPTWGVRPGRTIVVTTRPDPIKARDLAGLAEHPLVSDDRRRMSAWLADGILYATVQHRLQHGSTPFEVLGVASDVIGSPTALTTMFTVLRGCGLSLVGPTRPDEPGVRFLTKGDVRMADHRITGGCWMLSVRPGESPLIPDIDFRWHFAGDDLEMQARHARGAALVPVHSVVNRGPLRPVSTVQHVEWDRADRGRFVQKWGMPPW
jgi:hypothetical protein